MTDHARAVEVDTRLADLWAIQNTQHQIIRNSIDGLHHAAGDKRTDRWGKETYKASEPWTLTDEIAEHTVRCDLAAKTVGDWRTGLFQSYERDGETHVVRTSRGDTAQRNIETLDKARRDLAAAKREAAPLEAEYAAQPWPRFFLVTNANGHIHRSMYCSTTFPTTSWAWLPALSGLGEDAAVEQQGPRLCSVCYPSAPVEWTVGLSIEDKGYCAGSGQRAEQPDIRYTARGTCPVCKERFSVSRESGKVRAHKPPKGK